MKRLIGVLAVAVSASGPAPAADIEVGPADDWRGAIAALQPGDTLWMRDGVYPVANFFAIQRNGTASQPIAIRALPGGRPRIVQSGAQNVVNILSSSHLTLQGLELTGGAGSGVRIDASSDIVLADLLIHGVPESGIRANTPGSTVTRLVIDGVEVRQARQGVDLGCANDACRAIDATVRRGWFHDLVDTNLLAFGVRVQTGSQRAIVEDNVIHGVDLGLVILSALGTGGTHQVRRNAVWGTRDSAVQLVAHAVFENNLVLGSPGAIGVPTVRVSATQSTPSGLRIANNTIIASGATSALQLRNVAGATVVAGNALFSESGNAIDIASSTGVDVQANAGQGLSNGVTGGFTAVGAPGAVLVAAGYSGLPTQDFMPAAGGPLVGAANPAIAPAQDFDGIPRDAAPDIGAIERGGDPLDRWLPSPGFKRAARVFGDGFEG